MLLFMKYNLRAINYRFEVLDEVPPGTLLPNRMIVTSEEATSLPSSEDEDELLEIDEVSNEEEDESDDELNLSFDDVIDESDDESVPFNEDSDGTDTERERRSKRLRSRLW